jgi:hypothetical protein
MNKSKFIKWYLMFITLAWIGLLTPISVWIGINFDKYIIQTSGLTVTTGGILAVLFIVLLLKFGLKRFGKVFWMTMLLVIVMCLESIIVDALPLTFFTWLGVLIYTILEKPAHYFKNKLTVYTNEEVRVNARVNTTKQETSIKRSGRC